MVGVAAANADRLQGAVREFVGEVGATVEFLVRRSDVAAPRPAVEIVEIGRRSRVGRQARIVDRRSLVPELIVEPGVPVGFPGIGVARLALALGVADLPGEFSPVADVPGGVGVDVPGG